jgi:hypothetical protein
MQPQAQDLRSKLEDVITAARPHVTNEEFRKLEELTEYEDIIAGDNKDYGRTNEVLSPYRYGTSPTNSPAPEENTAGKTSGGTRDAWQHATTWDHRKVRRPLVVPHRFGQGKEWGTPFLRGLH